MTQEEALVQAREGLIRTSRSQQLAAGDLVVLLELVDWAIETHWVPLAKVATEYKLTSEGFPMAGPAT